MSQNNCPQSYNILDERGNVLARNCHHLIPTTERFNIKHDYDTAIPISNISAYWNLINDNQHDKVNTQKCLQNKI